MRRARRASHPGSRRSPTAATQRPCQRDSLRLCWDFACRRCIFARGELNDSDRPRPPRFDEEPLVGTILDSPTQPALSPTLRCSAPGLEERSGAAAPRRVDESIASGPMPCEVEGGEGIDVQQQAVAPSTPTGSKRDADAAAPVSPPKTLRSSPEPSNGQTMKLMEAMFARQERTTTEFCDLITDRLQKTEQTITHVDSRLSDLRDRYDRRLTELQAQLDNIEFQGVGMQDKEARDRLARLEQNMKQDAAKMANLEKKLSQAPPPSAPPVGSGPATRTDENVIIVGGLRQETPRDEIQGHWTATIFPKLQETFTADFDEVDIPYLLGSVLHLRFSSAVSARRCVAAIRSAPLQMHEEGEETIKIWATVRKSTRAATAA